LRKSILAAVLLAALALVLLLIFRREPPPAPAAASAEHGPVRDEPTSSTHAPAAAAIDVPKLNLGPAPSAEILEKSLTDYRAVSVYPPWSRAHFPGSSDKLTWNKPIIGDLPMDRREGHQTTYHFGADKFNVPYGEAITTWIEVLKVGETSERLPVQIKSAWLMSVGGSTQGRVVQVDYHDDGQDGDEVAGDHRYTNRLVPSQVAALKGAAQHVLIEAVIDAGGAGARPIMRDFTYAPRQALSFTGVTDAPKDGNLSVMAAVDVQEPGLYTFEANLMAADGTTPIAYTELSYTLAAGPQTAELKFFGKAFWDKRIDGPYVVKDLRCFRRFIAGEEENFYITYPNSYTTRAYRYTGFSNTDWDAPEKRETIANFERLINETNRGNIGVPNGENTGGGVHPSEPIR
jgi:hypothetical protein